jgi:hypothetical protein
LGLQGPPPRFTALPRATLTHARTNEFPRVDGTKTPEGITVSQDRFLDDSPGKEEDNTKLWTVPLAILSVDADGKPAVDNVAVLDAREANFKLETNEPFKHNAVTTGVCASRFFDLPCPHMLDRTRHA